MKTDYAFQIAKVVGTPSDGFWSQVHTFSPEEPEKKEKRGDLLAVLVITGVPQGVGAVAAGREVLGRLHEEYYGNLDGRAFERLRAAVEKIAGENENLEIVAAALVGGALYLAGSGKGKIYLRREGRLGILLQGDGSLQTASGLIAEGDLLVIGSAHFFKVVGSGVLNASLQSGSPDEAVETLAPIVLGRQDMAAAAAILALARKDEELPIGPVTVEENLPAEEPMEKTTPTDSLPQSRRRINLSFWKRGGLGVRERKPIFVRSEANERRKRVYFLVSLILLVLLGSSLILGVRKKMLERKRSQAGVLVREAEEKLNQGRALAAGNPNEGKVLGAESEKLADKALSLAKDYEEAVFLKSEAQKFISSLGEEINLNEPAVFMDLNIITDGARGVSFSLSDKNLAILDQDKNQIYLLNVEKKSSQIIKTDGEKGRYVAVSGQKIFIFDEEGIFGSLISQKSASLKIGKDNAWEKIAAFSSFGGNLYLLDKGAGSIWRYLWGDEGFGSKKSWFVSTPPDLSGSISMAIDGSIWVLTKDQILKFTLGKEESFSLTKMPESFQEPVKIYTAEEAENLYVLDKGRGKVYQIAKSGEFKAAYAWGGLKEAADLAAVESLKKLFILSGTKIYEVGLK